VGWLLVDHASSWSPGLPWIWTGELHKLMTQSSLAQWVSRDFTSRSTHLCHSEDQSSKAITCTGAYYWQIKLSHCLPAGHWWVNLDVDEYRHTRTNARPRHRTADVPATVLHPEPPPARMPTPALHTHPIRGLHPGSKCVLTSGPDSQSGNITL